MDKIRVKDILQELENFAPYVLQEGYDNSGLQVGDPEALVSGVLISLDCTELVVDEAIRKGCNTIVSHHPLIFKGLKQIGHQHYVERIVRKAIKNDINLISCHTNLDHVYQGVNQKIAYHLGLQNVQILSPKAGVLKKLVTFCPQSHVAQVQQAIFEAGGGQIGNYSECSFNTEGYGTFKANNESKPFVGIKNERHQEPETRIELVFAAFLEKNVLQALKNAHPYEEIAYDILGLENKHPQIGSGMMGELPVEMEEQAFLELLREKMGARGIRYSTPLARKVKRVALCGGSGFFLLSKAKQAKADVFVTADLKYHDFFEANAEILLADIGHYESEQYTNILLMDVLTKKIANFAIHITENNTNSINYLI